MALWDPGTMQRVLPGPAGSNAARAIRGAGAPVDGAAGSGKGVADRGWQYVDTATGFTYINHGTLTVPEWHGVIVT